MYQNTPQPQSNDAISNFKNWWATCPLFTRFIIYFCLILFILTRLPSLQTMLLNIPTKTIGEFQVTRLIFSPFCFLTISELILAFVAYLPLLANQEKNSGTLAAIVDFIIKNLEINLMYIGVCYGLSFFSSNFKNLPAYGLWGVFFVHMCEICLRDPDSTTPFLFTSFPIRNSLYPLILAVIFSIVSFAVRLDIIVAMLAGFLNIRTLNMFYFAFFNPAKVSEWENSSVVVWLRSFPNFITYGSLSGPLINDNDGSGYPPIGGGYQVNSNRNSGVFEGYNGGGGSNSRRGSETRGKVNYTPAIPDL